MDTMELMKARHSVRAFQDKAIEADVVNKLQTIIEACNQAGGLHIQLCLDEPQAFDHFLSRLQKFSNAKNYLVMVGPVSEQLDEKIGWYGERIGLRAQELGLGTCWVTGTYSKKKCGGVVLPGEKRPCIIAVGYPENPGVPHKTKSMEELCKVDGAMPDWFRRGMEAALLAPTGNNKQKFLFTLEGDTVTAKAGFGLGAKVDLGIVKYHFQLGAGQGTWKWAKGPV